MWTGLHTSAGSRGGREKETEMLTGSWGRRHKARRKPDPGERCCLLGQHTILPSIQGCEVASQPLLFQPACSRTFRLDLDRRTGERALAHLQGNRDTECRHRCLFCPHLPEPGSHFHPVFSVGDLHSSTHSVNMALFIYSIQVTRRTL